jgi:serine/threonine protein kinase
MFRKATVKPIENVIENVIEKKRKIKFGDKTLEVKIKDTELPDTEKDFVIDKMLSKNKFYMLFSIKNDDTKYIKVINAVASEIENTKVLNGLNTQFELSKKCNNICKIYEYGINEENNILNHKVNYGDTEDKIDIFSNSFFSVIEKLDNFQINTFSGFIKDNIVKNKEYKNIFHGILSGLNCIHDKNVFHLNINPNSIGINIEDNKAKIFDFSNSVDMENDSQTPINLKVNMYTDPKILRAETIGEVDSKSDIYSVGIMLLTTFFKNDTIHNLFNDDSIKNMYKKDSFINEEMLDLDWAKNNLRIKVDDLENLIDLIKNMLKQDKNERFTAEQALEHEWFETWKDAENTGGKKTVTRKKRRPTKIVRKQKTNKKIRNKKIRNKK